MRCCRSSLWVPETFKCAVWVKSIGFAARGLSHRPDRNIPPHARKNLWRTQGAEGAGDGEWHSAATWARIQPSVASLLTSSEKFIRKINQLFFIQLIYGTWSRFRPRANFAICSICSAISLATFTIELFSSSHLSVSSCSSWAANYKTSNKTSTIRAPQEIIMISWRASRWMKKTLLYFFKVNLLYFYLPVKTNFLKFFLFKIGSDKIVQHWAMPRKFNAAIIFV